MIISRPRRAKSALASSALIAGLITAMDVGDGAIAARLQPADAVGEVVIRIAPLHYESAHQSFIVRQKLLEYATELAGGRADAGERNYELERCDGNPTCDVITIAQVSREFHLYLKDGRNRFGEYPKTWLCPADFSNESCPTHSITEMKRILRAHRRQFHP